MDDFIRRSESARLYRESTRYEFGGLTVTTHSSKPGVVFSTPMFGTVVSRGQLKELADLLYKIAG